MEMKIVRVLSLITAGVILLSSGSLSFAAGDAKPSATALDNTTVATVNGRKISKELLDKVLEQAPQGVGTDDPESRKAVLSKMVEIELVAQEAEKQGLSDDPMFKLNMEMLRKQQLYVTLMKKVVVDAVKTTPEDVKAAYEADKAKYVSGEEVQASHILVDTEDDAKKIKERLDKGEDFAAVAKDKSKCPSASRGGDLGFFGKGKMVPEFEKAAFALKEGEISAPVKTQFGWHLIKITATKKAEQKKFEDVKADIEQKLTQEKQKKAYEDFMASIKAKGEVKINEALFKTAKAADSAAPAAGDKPTK